MISINYRDARPIYEQVKDGFRQLIVTGVLPKDSRLPSVRELAAELAINPNTIQRAYRELESEGYVVSAAGRGSFVCDVTAARESRKQELCAELQKTARELRSLGMSERELLTIITGGGDK